MSRHKNIDFNADTRLMPGGYGTWRRLGLVVTLSLSLFVCSHALAQSAETNPEAKSTPDVSATQDATRRSPATEPEGTDSKPPQDTLGGSGLKDRKLSTIFEQFVPSETISADNAVPFPTDI